MKWQIQSSDRISKVEEYMIDDLSYINVDYNLTHSIVIKDLSLKVAIIMKQLIVPIKNDVIQYQ